MKIAWVTDSASCIELAYAKVHNIHVVPLTVIIDGESWKDLVELDEAAFYQRIAEGKTPSTSQPSVGDFEKLYRELKEFGYDAVVAIHTSSKLTGTMNASKMAADMVDLPIYVIDSGVVAKPVWFLVNEAIRLYEERKSLQDIIAGVEALKDNVVGYIMLNDLQFLHRGGRLSTTSTLVGTLLQIKPILVVKNQVLELYEKVRTGKKAKAVIHGLLENDVAHKTVKEISVVHAHHLEEATVWLREIQEKFPHIPITISTLGTVVGVHSGPGAIGLTWRM